MELENPLSLNNLDMAGIILCQKVSTRFRSKFTIMLPRDLFRLHFSYGTEVQKSEAENNRKY
jgi:hypothetical protein